MVINIQWIHDARSDKHQVKVNWNNIFETRAEFFLAEKWKRNGTKLAEEYCWAITKAAGRSRCGRSGSSVLEFGFQLKSVVTSLKGLNILRRCKRVSVGRVAQSVQRLATGRTVRGSSSGGGKIFRTRPDRAWGPASLLYNGYLVFAGGKAAWAWRWPSTLSIAEVKGRVELYPGAN